VETQSRRRIIVRRVLAAALVVIPVAVLAFVLVGGTSDPARDRVEQFFEKWAAGEYEAAAEHTDGDTAAVAAALEANVNGLDGAELEASVSESEEREGRRVVPVQVSWRLRNDFDWGYENRIPVAEGDDGWRIVWSERVVHRRLRDGERLGTMTEFEPRAPIIARDGRELTSMRPVVDVGVVPAEAGDLGETASAVAELTGADRRAFLRALRGAGEDSFVSAITMREEDVDPIESELLRIDGVQLAGRELSLAPTREFARATLGTVGPITEEQQEELGPEYGIGAQVGQFGLQARFERRLAGTPSLAIVIRQQDGAPVETLAEEPGEPGRPVRTTLDFETQRAAEAALDGVKAGALVAVQPSSGDILAVATRPVEDSFNRALEGTYPPGSTFKVVSTTALLRAGLDVSETVNCPPTANVGGRSFRNFEGGAEGAVSFARDFAVSCNTAFVALAERLEPTALRETARAFGIGVEPAMKAPYFPGDVPPGRDPVEEAAAMIGQARITASPLALAGIAATVAEGRWRAPRLLASDPREAGEPLPEADTLRQLMRQVVTDGSGAALAGVPGEPAGKSGTAEYGGGDPPPTHAWFISYRGDLAVAVLVEDAPSGGGHAAPVVAEFYERLGAG
jgi:cell division protein FtsI/penicillin-binding protein 2